MNILFFFDDGHTPGNIKACRQVPLRTPRKVNPMLANINCCDNLPGCGTTVYSILNMHSHKHSFDYTFR